MNNKHIIGIFLISLNIAVWLIVAMMVWKSRRVDDYVYSADR